MVLARMLLRRLNEFYECHIWLVKLEVAERWPHFSRVLERGNVYTRSHMTLDSVSVTQFVLRSNLQANDTLLGSFRNSEALMTYSRP